MNSDARRFPISTSSLPCLLVAPPLCPEANFSNRTNPSVEYHHFNDDPFDERRLCHGLPVFIPVGEPNLLDISNQDTRAAIDLSQQPQNTLVIATAVVTDMIQEGDRGSGWDRPRQWLPYCQEMPLSITSQGQRLTALDPTGHNGFPILPSSPIFDRQSRLADRCRSSDCRREALQIRRKPH
jgi:hypothetical protein